jgi:hypothetical protein
MAGPLVFWANRKSKLGLRHNVSKRPYAYAHRRPFVTTPPIAEEPMLDLTTLGGVDELALVKDENAKLKRQNEGLRADLREMLDGTAAQLDRSERTLAEARRLVESTQSEFEQLRAELRDARKEADPETLALKIMYGVDAATEHHHRELGELRAVIATKDSEISELKRSKRRLREALDRLSKET